MADSAPNTGYEPKLAPFFSNWAAWTAFGSAALQLLSEVSWRGFRKPPFCVHSVQRTLPATSRTRNRGDAAARAREDHCTYSVAKREMHAVLEPMMQEFLGTMCTKCMVLDPMYWRHGDDVVCDRLQSTERNTTSRLSDAIWTKVPSIPFTPEPHKASMDTGAIGAESVRKRLECQASDHVQCVLFVRRRARIENHLHAGSCVFLDRRCHPSITWSEPPSQVQAARN